MKAVISDVKELRGLLLALKKERSIDACRIMADEDHLIFQGFGEDHIKSYRLDEAVDQEGSCIIELMEFDKIVAKLKKIGGSIGIDLDGDYVEFAHDSLNFRLGLSHYDLPGSRDRIEATTVTAPGPDLKAALESCLIAASTEQKRPAICAVNLTSEGMWSTDGHRMRLYDLPLPVGDETVGVPTSTVKALTYGMSKLADGGDVEISFNAEKIVFSFGGHSVVSNRVQKGAPDFRGVLPNRASANARATIDSKSALEALDVIKIIASKKTNRVNFKVDKSNKHPIYLYASSAKNKREGTAPIEGTISLGNERVSFGVNHDYLIDAIKDLGVDEVEISILDTLAPVKIQASGDGRDNHFWIVMPMRL